MTPVYVRGIGLWSPGYPTPDRWCRGEPSENADQPEAKILVGPLRRRASLLTKISVEAMTQAIAQAGCDQIGRAHV